MNAQFHDNCQQIMQNRNWYSADQSFTMTTFVRTKLFFHIQNANEMANIFDTEEILRTFETSVLTILMT